MKKRLNSKDKILLLREAVRDAHNLLTIIAASPYWNVGEEGVKIIAPVVERARQALDQTSNEPQQ
jgi:hypothetical protein